MNTNVVDGKSLIISNEWVNDEYKHMVIEVENHKAADVAPGQFFQLYCPHTDENKPFFRRPMSTYFANSDSKQVEFLYKVVGAGTKGLSQLKKDETLQLLGPLGQGFTLTADDKHILVLGRGVGLATLAPLAEYAGQRQIKVTAILSAKDKKRLMSQHRFVKALADVVEVLDSDNSSEIGNVEQLIRNIHATQPIDAFFTCGSVRLAKLLQRLSLELDIRGEVALEQNMACGIGMCYGCVIAIKAEGQEQSKSKKVCQDGPVFNIREVMYD